MADISAATVGKRLAVVREALGLSQRQLAVKAGISPNALNQYEKGRMRVPLEAAVALFEAHQVTLDYLYLGFTGSLPQGLLHKIAEHSKRGGDTQ
jgi:transcriptional regulator with XRE-family HTH domain